MTFVRLSSVCISPQAEGLVEWTKVYHYSLCILVIFRGIKVFEPPRFMSVMQAASQLLEAVQSRQSKGVVECKIQYDIDWFLAVQALVAQ